MSVYADWKRRALMTAPPSGTDAVALRELRWIRHDRVALLLVARRAAARLRHPVADLQQCRHPRPQGRCRRHRPHGDFARPSSRRSIRRPASASPAIDRHTARCAPSAPARRSPPSTSREFRARHRGRQAPADRDLLQQAIFHARQHRLGALGAARGSDRRAAAEADASGYAPGPLVVEQYVLTNPALNYAQFLLRAILPTVLHVVIAIAPAMPSARSSPAAASAHGCARRAAIR